MDIITNTNIKNDLNDVLRLFDYKGGAELNAYYEKGALITRISLDKKQFEFNDSLDDKDSMLFKRLHKRICKIHLYEVLKAETGINLPWGSLTGIRPVRLFNQIKEETGKDPEAYFTDFFDVSKEKTALVKEISGVQKKFYNIPANSADLYIGIPFCRGRCSYCSFFSADIEKSGGLVDIYTNCLIKEIQCARELINQKGYIINSLYAGGGTPSSLPLKNLRAILSELSGISCGEFTFEAGRPDSINKELLGVLKSCKVSRISINPQTAKDETLRLVGRRHTFGDALNAYRLAKEYDFIINTDIIAGLPGETLIDFINTAGKISALKPHNVTVHTLAIKQGSDLKANDYRHKTSDIGQMLDYAGKILHENGYYAYYLYKQKNAAGNLENTGYSLPGFECRYNIDNMDDTVNIIACGANSISKRVFSGGRIERQANPKDIKTYCEKIGELCGLKRDLFNG